ncbi:MAG: HAMP domain-containing histidine kinase [Bacilli bacterium]|nr:HAMP domain-containing histidine kinase [Bacilli bacterium]MBQ7105387.1 HAMP domain-containing histidine kinase [Bacilli bacterium]
MRTISNNLGRQLLSIFIINFCIIVIFIGNVVPNIIKNRFESSIYENLKSQLEDLNSNIEAHVNIGDTAYIYIEDDIFYMSPNIYDMLGEKDSLKIIEYMDDTYGEFKYKNHLYYYYKIVDKNNTKISLIEGSFVLKTEEAILTLSLLILLLVYIGITLIISLWSRSVVKKIEKIKSKVDNIDNPNYKFEEICGVDELSLLDSAIDDMRVSLLKQEELRSQLYQNISHDFKTPLTVIKSYIEAVEDGVENSEKAMQVILEQTNKLEAKVHSLLYLNKLDYLKDEDFNFRQKIDINRIVDLSIDKFKYHNSDVKIEKSTDKNVSFYGTDDIWETIIDNILSNFYRYAESKIKINIKNNKIILYNDGPSIKEDFLEAMFIPFRKGIKGEFGLGLSIVKKSLVMIGYDIEVKNHNKKGVSFIITKKGS